MLNIYHWVIFLSRELNVLHFTILSHLNMCMMQKLKTRVIKRDVNPEWNEDLTLSVQDPDVPVKIVSFFSLFLPNTRVKT